MYLGDINLSKEPNAMPPLPLGLVHKRELRQFVIRNLEQAGCSGKMLLTYYNTDPIIWEIPQLYTRIIDKQAIAVRPTLNVKRSTNQLWKAYTATAEQVSRHGLTTENLQKLAEVCGPITLHPMAFSRETQDLAKARLLFDMEFVVFVKDIAAHAVIEGDTVSARLVRHHSYPLVGVLGGRHLEKRVHVDTLQDTLYYSRGTIQFPQSDLYDRLYHWVTRHYIAFEYADQMLKALSFLKLSQDHSDYYSLEQEIASMEPYKGSPLPMKAELYTDAAFDHIRDVWLQTEMTVTERSRLLLPMIVPAYMDAYKFIEFFGGDPTAKKKHRNYEHRFYQGMNKFTEMFLETQRRIKEGHFVGME